VSTSAQRIHKLCSCKEPTKGRLLPACSGLTSSLSRRLLTNKTEYAAQSLRFATISQETVYESDASPLRFTEVRGSDSEPAPLQFSERDAAVPPAQASPR
jgi:hypothetical protein